MIFSRQLLQAPPRCQDLLRSAANANVWLRNHKGYNCESIFTCASWVVISHLMLLILLNPLTASAAEPAKADHSPAFTTVPELRASFDLLYRQRFAAARQGFESWESHNPKEPFGEVAIAASYLFEELYRQNVLSSDFFLDDKKFLRGIDGKPDPQRMSHFREHLTRARELARARQKIDPNDAEALFAFTLSAGMESDVLAILERKHLEALKRMKEADKYAKQLLAHHPETTDAYIAPGIANYIVGSFGSGSRVALWFGGIRGDKKTGMEQITKTATTGRYLQPFAKIILALAARREHQPVLAQRLLGELTEQYPGNTLYAFEYSKAKRVTRP